jgi:hypothetical protein
MWTFANADGATVRADRCQGITARRRRLMVPRRRVERQRAGVPESHREQRDERGEAQENQRGV